MFLSKCHIKFVTDGPIEDTSLLDQVMAWHKLGDKALLLSILIKSFGAMRRYQATMS